MEQGLTAVVSIGVIRLVMRSNPGFEWDTGIYTAFGLRLEEAALVFVKSPSHFKVAFAAARDAHPDRRHPWPDLSQHAASGAFVACKGRCSHLTMFSGRSLTEARLHASRSTKTTWFQRSGMWMLSFPMTLHVQPLAVRVARS